MAKLLYRIGHFAARRSIFIVAFWIIAVAAAGTGMNTLQKPLDSTFTLPGSEFSKVLDHLGKQIPAVAGGSSTVVIQAKEPFTSEDKSEMKQVFKQWGELAIIKQVMDPFETQNSLDESQTNLKNAHKQLQDSEKQYNDGQFQIKQLAWIVEQGSDDIKRIQANNPNDPSLPTRIDSQNQLEKKLADSQKQLADSQKQLQDGWSEYATNQQLASMTREMRTISKDGRTALIQIRFHKSTNEIEPSQMAAIPKIGDPLRDKGLKIEYGQEISNNTDMGGAGETIGMVVAAFVLLLMFGSVLLAGLPLTSAITGVAVALMSAMTVTHWFSLQQMAPVLGSMLGLAVGIDYSLFIVNRYRNILIKDIVETNKQPSKDQIRHHIGMAMGTAGSAVAVAGSTVIISLAALAIARIPSLNQMGAVAAITVFTSVMVALTLTPALLSLIGKRAIPRKMRHALASGTSVAEAVGSKKAKKAAKADPDGDSEHPIAQAWVDFITRRAPFVVLAGVILLSVIAIPAASLELGLPDGGNDLPDSTAYKSYVMIEENFGAGANGPILVVADFPKPVAKDDQVNKQVEIGQEIMAIPGVLDVVPIGVSDDKLTMAFQVASETGPSDPDTVFVVHAIEDDVAPTFADDGINIGVTGATVANIEVSDRLAQNLIPYLVLVMGLSLLLLTVVFRSVVVPVLATLGFLLSVAASIGVVVAVYQWGWLSSVFAVNRPGPVFSFMPTLLIGILFGLAMDYQMFLVSGMHEAHSHGVKAVAAVKSGFTLSARVVCAAGMIMVSVFGGFIYSPMTMTRPIALGLAVGVLVDAFVVRLTLTPAAMKLLGEKAWWLPKWLGKILPHVDVEGAGLVEQDKAAKETPVASSAEGADSEN
jgi:RND superfamily putative drug exporter